MLNPTYPGVYVQEQKSDVHTITGVSTSTTAFVGGLRRGPLKATRVLDFGAFTRIFGGLDADRDLTYAVQQFFANGGSEAWVVRVVKDGKDAAGKPTQPREASVAVDLFPLPWGSAPVPAALTFSAKDPGAWGDRLRLVITWTDVDDGRFDLTVLETAEGDSDALRVVESYGGLSLDPASPNFLPAKVNVSSDLVSVSVDKGVDLAAAVHLPAPTGTVGAPVAPKDVPGDKFSVTVGGKLLSDALALSSAVAQAGLKGALWAATAATKLQGALQPALRGARVQALDAGDGKFVFVVAAPTGEGTLTLAGPAAAALGLADPATVVAAPERRPLAGGVDGDVPGGAELVGDESSATGIYALVDAPVINLLCMPDTMRLPPTDAALVAAAATSYAATRRAMYLLDPPQEQPWRPNDVLAWMSENDTLRSPDAVAYYPRPMLADPLRRSGLRPFAASGVMAGVYAATDASRGVWKAPAGTGARLVGVQDLDYVMTDPENGLVNKLGINALRKFPVHGNVSWGARTLAGADDLASEWKYVPVRRTALYIEQSLYNGLKWAVFEPNDERLWAAIRLNVGSFMSDLFRQGAFQGSSAKDAYFVRCDASTTRQSDVDRGIVNVIVGFAPLKPAEFVILTIQQNAGKLEG